MRWSKKKNITLFELSGNSIGNTATSIEQNKPQSIHILRNYVLKSLLILVLR